MCADLDEKRLENIKTLYPALQTTRHYKDILNNRDIDAVCVAVPTNMHYAVTKEALDHGKHVLCEKPLALKPEECEELKQLALRVKKVLMVGHVFVFNSGIVWMKNYIGSGDLGKIYYAYSNRTNLGPFRYDVNALWDLAPHDIAIFNYLFDSCPVSVSANGQKYLGSTLEDLAFVNLLYPHNLLVNVHVSWLDPKKVRQITIVGDKKMLVWDDLDQSGPVKVYDKHVEKTTTYYATYGEFQLLSQEGSTMIPKINAVEPLKSQGEYFIKCIKGEALVEKSDAQKGRDVVKTLCAIQQSMDREGERISIN